MAERCTMACMQRGDSQSLGASARDFLEKLLAKYEHTFDVSRSFVLGGVAYPAYAYFASSSEKYILRKEAVIWAAHSFEHVLFVSGDGLNSEKVAAFRELMENTMEPALVRRGKKYPEADHMVSYLTLVVLAEKSPSPETVKAVEKFRWERSYLFTFRGKCEGHLVLIDLESKKVYMNKPTKELREFFVHALGKS